MEPVDRQRGRGRLQDPPQRHADRNLGCTPTYADSGLSEATSYDYAVSAFDAAGNTSAPSSTVRATTLDVTAPSVPTGLKAQAVSSSRIDVSWNASTDNVAVTTYKLFRDGTLIATGPAASFQDTGRTAGTTYSYTVLAADQAGNESAQSAAVAATTPAPDSSPPSASVTAPVDGSVVSGNVTVSADAADDVGVAGVQFLLDGASLGAEDTSAPYSRTWDTTSAANGPHSLQARSRDAAGGIRESAARFRSRSPTSPRRQPPDSLRHGASTRHRARRPPTLPETATPQPWSTVRRGSMQSTGRESASIRSTTI